MILYPAIDLKDGNAVRLLRGDMDKSTVFNTDPAAQAREFVDAGCEWLHLVDLNGAFEGEPVNAAPVEAILSECKGARAIGRRHPRYGNNRKLAEQRVTARDFGHRCR